MSTQQIHLSFTVIAALFAYSVATAAAVMLFRRTYSWQVKCLSVLVAVIPVCEAVRLLRDMGVLFSFGSRELTELAELAVAGLFLVCVLALNRECASTQNKDERLCLAEAAAGWSTIGPHRSTRSHSLDLVQPNSNASGARQTGASTGGERAAGARGCAVAVEAQPSLAPEPDVDPFPDPSERRGEPRYPSKGKVWIVVRNPEPIGELLADVVDVSRSGLRLAVPFRLEPGTELEANFGQTELHGEVRWCKENGDGRGFSVGVLLRESLES